MATKKPKITTDKGAAIDAMNQALHGVMTVDAFQNILTRQGFGMPGLGEATNYLNVRLTRNYNLLNTLYRSSWIVQGIVTIPADDMLANWLKYKGQITPEEVDLLQKAERKTAIKDTLLEGLYWGRLYGGAVGLMIIDGQEHQLDQPLDVDSIMPGDFKGLLIADRWSGVYPELHLVSDINDPEFGLPEFYSFRGTMSAESKRVHHSRIIRFTGKKLPNWERVAETFWGSSEIEVVMDDLKRRDNTAANMAGLVFLANQRIIKKAGLDTLLATANDAAKKRFHDTIQMQNALMNNFSLQLLGDKDEFSNVTMSFAGIPETYDRIMMDVAGASKIPVTRLFGRSPAGMNATGEGDEENYNRFIEREQQTHVRPAFDKLLPVICMSSLGYIPDDIDYDFNPVTTPDPKEMADLFKVQSESVLSFFQEGLTSARVTLMEAKQLGEAAGCFANITDEDIAAASDEAVGPLPALGENPLDTPESDPNAGGE